MEKLFRWTRSDLVTGLVAVFVILFLAGMGVYDKINSARPAAQPVKTKTSGTVPQKSSTPTQSSSSLAGKKIAYLTFDDGPSKLTPGLLKLLKQNNVNATFFVVGKGENAAQKQEWIKQEIADGNEVGIHSWTHDYKYIYANEQNFLTDYNKIHDFIVSATGTEPKFMRFPGGIGNTVSIEAAGGKIIMSKLVKDLEDRGVTPIDWNAGGEDAVSHVPSKETLAQNIIKECKGKTSAVILLHDSATHQSSIDAVPLIISALKAQGFEFRTLSAQTPKVQERVAKASSRYKHPTVIN